MTKAKFNNLSLSEQEQVKERERSASANEDRVELELQASESKSELDNLSAIIERVASAQASDAIDYLVASCALCFDKMQEHTTRATFMTLTNERANFIALKSNVTIDTERATFDMQDSSHRTYCTRYACRKTKNNDALMIARVRRSLKKHVTYAREQADYSHTLLSLKLSEKASALLKSKLDDIVNAYANDDYKRALKASKASKASKRASKK